MRGAGQRSNKQERSANRGMSGGREWARQGVGAGEKYTKGGEEARAEAQNAAQEPSVQHTQRCWPSSFEPCGASKLHWHYRCSFTAAGLVHGRWRAPAVPSRQQGWAPASWRRGCSSLLLLLLGAVHAHNHSMIALVRLQGDLRGEGREGRRRRDT